MKLLIISHTPHYLRPDGTLVGWGATVREIDYLAKIFAEIVHIAPLHQEEAPASSLPYTAENVEFRPVRPAGGRNLSQKLRIASVIDSYVKIIKAESARADVVQIRCPANISLIALLVMAGFPRPPYLWVKYAGNWQPNGKTPWSYTLQRWWLNRGLHRGMVTINGRWPRQPPWVHSFLNPCLTLAEIEQAKAMVAAKQLSSPLQMLFVGRVEEAKGVGRILEIALALKKQGIAFHLHIVGDGPEKPTFGAWVRDHDLVSLVTFYGWQPRPALAAFYARAHFFLFPSATEGWPKVLSEAMAYGAVPLAGAVSSIPQIMAEMGCGVALPPLDLAGYVAAMHEYIAHPEKWQQQSLAGRAAAPQFTYEAYGEQLNRIFQEQWGLSLSSSPV